MARIFQNIDSALFICLVYVMGIAASIGHNFTYVRFREIGGTGTHMGTSRMCSSIGGAIMFWYSGTLSLWLGIDNVFICSLLTVVMRFAICAKMSDPRWGYLSELLRGLVFGLFWSSATIYASHVASEDARATMMQILHSVYNGLGRSTGALLGGKLQAKYGTVGLFENSAIGVAFLAGVLILHKLRKRNVSGVEESSSLDHQEKEKIQ